MNELFKFPLRVVEVSNDDLVISDRTGQTVVRLNWSLEGSHMARQKMIGNAIVSALTNCFYQKKVPSGQVEGEPAGNGDSFCSTGSDNDVEPKKKLRKENS